jgi:uncharacterized membrane protein
VRWGILGLFYFLILGLLSTRNKNIEKEERCSKRKKERTRRNKGVGLALEEKQGKV